MARKAIRESELSSGVRSVSGKAFDVIRVETKLDDGWSDLLMIERATGLPHFVELKQIDTLNKQGYTRINLEAIQAIFLWERARACSEVGSAVILRVGSECCYVLPARLETEWCRWIRSPLFLDSVPEPFCYRRPVSVLPRLLQQIRGARFTKAPLPWLEAA